MEDASGGSWPVVLDEPVPAPGAKRPSVPCWADGRRASPCSTSSGTGHFASSTSWWTGRVLIPRPETEVVVEVALGELARPLDASAYPVVVDLGTGSGAIALSIVTECAVASKSGRRTCPAKRSTWRQPTWRALGRKRSGSARLAQGSWWSALPVELEGSLDLAVANPPYVAEGEQNCRTRFRGGSRSKRWSRARRGSRRSRRSWAKLRSGLAARSVLVAEIAPHQDRAAVNLARSAGFVDVRVRNDLAGRERVLVAKSFA